MEKDARLLRHMAPNLLQMLLDADCPEEGITLRPGHADRIRKSLRNLENTPEAANDLQDQYADYCLDIEHPDGNVTYVCSLYCAIDTSAHETLVEEGNIYARVNIGVQLQVGILTKMPWLEQHVRLVMHVMKTARRIDHYAGANSIYSLVDTVAEEQRRSQKEQQLKRAGEVARAFYQTGITASVQPLVDLVGETFEVTTPRKILTCRVLDEHRIEVVLTPKPPKRRGRR